MQSNRLVVTLNKEMQIGFERGLNQVYENSNLVNEFVVRPSFLLEPMQSLWVTFKDAESNATLTLKPTLLAERKVTAISSDKQDVDNDVAQIAQTVSTGYEYYTLLPKEVTQAPGTWYFSVEICQAPDGTNYSEDDFAKLMQIKTSDIASFNVYSSLAGKGPNGSAPSDLDVLNLYNTALKAVTDAEQSATAATTSAKSAERAVAVTEKIVSDAVDDIFTRATEQTIAATEQAVVDESNRAKQVEAELAQSIDADSKRVNDIQKLIPSSASPANTLADEAFVNSLINDTKAYIDDTVANAINTVLNTSV